MALITRDQIEKRKAELMASKEQLQSAYLMTVGQIEDCDFWLMALEARELEKPSEPAAIGTEILGDASLRDIPPVLQNGKHMNNGYIVGP